MARKQKPAEHENHERWLVSYADLLTLLFAFFVVMFASSQTDKARAQQVSDSVKQALEKGGIAAAVREVLGGTVDDRGKGNALMKGPGGAQPRVEKNPERPLVAAELLPAMTYLSQELKTEIEAGKLEIRLEPRGLVISLRQATFFPSGGDSVAPATFPSFDKVASIVSKLPNSVRLEGHTDSVPINTVRFRSNWELSAARAIAVLELLAGRYQISRSRMAIAGYADNVLVASNETEEGRAHNRRVDVVILNQLMAINDSDLGAQPSKPPETTKSHAEEQRPAHPGR